MKLEIFSDIYRTLYVEPLLRIVTSRFRWFRHVARMSQERLANQVLVAALTGKRPRSHLRTG